MGSVVEGNEAIRCEYISTILHACICIVKQHTGKEISLKPQLEVVGEENAGRVDYAVKALEELICITEGKKYEIAIGFAQVFINDFLCLLFFHIVQKLIMFFISKNILQCESALQTNKKKRKASDAFREDYDYLLGIVTTATEWYFLLYTSEGILCTSQREYHISLTKAVAKEEKCETGNRGYCRFIKG